ncbi:hypothetical protein TSAR_017032 [Trichomalopsis sarcophagae]|uniref:protein-tyrosine-phosphatase n=1 Tax=Trichomalopsis sarcophagae TaxID=543379 RepID=A0A232FGZ3_9HYME|nr:hypothetical protein TSAR_017032 [Trichomalopsis sarcophagae]
MFWLRHNYSHNVEKKSLGNHLHLAVFLCILSRRFVEQVSVFERDVGRGYFTRTFVYVPTDNESIVIEDLKIVKASADSLTVSWSANHENLTSYLIQWFKDDEFVGNASKIFSFQDKIEFTIESLEACSIYNITVTPQTIFDIDNDATKSVIGKTALTQPDAPLIQSASPGKINDALMLNVSWKVPKVGRYCIKHYLVRAEAEIYNLKHFVTQNTPNTSIVLPDLYACTSYKVIVKAIDRNDGKGLESSLQAKPTLDKVTIAPKLVNSINVPPFISTRTTITLNWNVLDQKNNCSIDSVWTDCNYSYTEGYGFEVKERGTTNVTTHGQNPRIVRLLVQDLSPFTKYICWGWTINSAGWSRFGMPVPVFTKQDVPSAPENFRHLENTQFTFAWDAPKSMPGQQQKYKLTTSWKPLYPVPDFCNVTRSAVMENIRPTANNYTWKGGEGYSEYTAYMEASTDAGWGSKSESITFLSDQKGVPDKVTNLDCQTRLRKNDSNALETILSWNLPCSLKGRLKQFELSVFGSRPHSENHVIDSVIFIHDINSLRKNKKFSYSFGELRPEYSYIFSVSATIHGTDEKGEVAKLNTEYPAGIPPQPTKTYIKSITLNPNKIQRTSTSFEILLPLFSQENGNVQYYAILVSQLGFNKEQRSMRFDSKNGDWPDVASWRESMERDFKLPYQASEPRWSPYPNHILDYGSIRAVKIVIGDDITCKDVSMTTKGRLYCNGPLKPDTWYEVRMRAFTYGGYADSTPFKVKTGTLLDKDVLKLFLIDAEMSVGMIIGIVIGILLIGIIVALLLAWKSHAKRKEKKSTEEEENDQDRNRNRRLTMNTHSHSYENSAARTRRRYEQ